MHAASKTLSKATMRAISREANPFRLAKILDENNVARAGVHPFFANDIKDGLDKKSGIYEYEKYILDVTCLFSRKEDFSSSIFIFESTSYSVRTACEIFESKKLEFTPAFPPFFSASGRIHLYSGLEKNGIESCRHMQAINGANKSFGIMESLLLKASGVFVFGMFAEDCVSRAIIDIKRMLASNGKEAQIMQNSISTKYISDFF